MTLTALIWIAHLRVMTAAVLVKVSASATLVIHFVEPHFERASIIGERGCPNVFASADSVGAVSEHALIRVSLR